MGRKPISLDIRTKIVTFRGQGLKLDAIWKAVRDPETELPDRRTVARYVKKYDELPDSVRQLDRPFEWHRLEEYGLPWEAGEWLLDLWFVAQESWLGTVPPEDPFLSVLTVRRVLWWWRLHLAAPEVERLGSAIARDVGKIDLILLAEQFVTRELAHHVLGEELYLADLEALIAYKPWVEERLETYRQAVKERRVPETRVRFDLIAQIKRVLLETDRGQPDHSELAALAEGGTGIRMCVRCEGSHMDRLLYNQREVCERLRIGRSTLQHLVAAGRIQAVRIGRSLRFTETELQRFVAELEAEAAATTDP